MRGALLRALSAVLLAVVATGCGDDEEKDATRRGEDLARKQIKAAEKSAARSCIVIYARRKRLTAERLRDRLRLPVDDAESRVKEAEDRFRAGDARAKDDVAKARAELNRVMARVGPQLGPVEKKVAQWTALLAKLKKSKGVRLCQIVDHTVKEQNTKTPNDRRSVMRLKPTAHKDVLGAGELKFNLSWRKVVRSNPYTKGRANWELRKVEPVTAEDED